MIFTQQNYCFTRACHSFTILTIPAPPFSESVMPFKNFKCPLVTIIHLCPILLIIE